MSKFGGASTVIALFICWCLRVYLSLPNCFNTLNLEQASQLVLMGKASVELLGHVYTDGCRHL